MYAHVKHFHDRLKLLPFWIIDMFSEPGSMWRDRTGTGCGSRQYGFRETHIYYSTIVEGEIIKAVIGLVLLTMRNSYIVIGINYQFECSQ